MNETIKTIAFGAIAVVALILSYLTSQKPDDSAGEESKMGQALFETFDPMTATGIEIAEFDEDSSDAKSLEIVKDVAASAERKCARADGGRLSAATAIPYSTPALPPAPE